MTRTCQRCKKAKPANTTHFKIKRGGGDLSRTCIACATGRRQRHGLANTPTYNTWRAMKTRCANPNDDHWAYYGGRGVRVWPGWRKSFAIFLADMGERPAGTTLDRVDPDGDYEPGNCRWATHEQQRANKRSARVVPTSET